VERIVFFIGTGQLRLSAGMNGAEDMVVDHDMVVTHVFRRLGKRLDRPGIAAKFGLRINHTSFHRPLPLSPTWGLTPDTGHSRPVRKQRTKYRHIIFAMTRSQITRSDDDRERQTEQMSLGPIPPVSPVLSGRDQAFTNSLIKNP